MIKHFSSMKSTHRHTYCFAPSLFILPSPLQASDCSAESAEFGAARARASASSAKFAAGDREQCRDAFHGRDPAFFIRGRDGFFIGVESTDGFYVFIGGRMFG